MDSSNVDGSTVAPEVPLFHWRSYRLYLLLILMFTFGITSCNYMNLGITITCMVDATFYEKAEVVARPEECPNFMENTTELGYTGELKWTPMQQSQLFAVFFWFSLLTMGFSGALSDRFNAKYLITMATVSYAGLSLLSPLLANWHYYAFLASRAIMGAVEGFVFPCMTTIVAHWIPPSERSTAAAIYTSGHQLASVISVLISSRLCLVDFLGGWPLIFIFFGVCCVLTAIMFLALVSNRPEESKFMSQQELNYIHEQLANEGIKKKHEKKMKVPWKSIFLSPVVHSIMCSEFSYSFSTSIFIYYLPSFFRDVMAFDVENNGFFTSIPFIFQMISKILISVIADKLKAKYGFSATSACKVLQTVSTMGTAAVFISMGLFLDCTQQTLAKILVALFGVFFAGEVAGAFTATLYIAPSFTGTLSSITTIFGAVGGIVCPTIVGFINKHGTAAEWSRVFFAGAVVNIIAGIVFLIFGSAQIQPWAVEQSKVHQLSGDDLKEPKQIDEKF